MVKIEEGEKVKTNESNVDKASDLSSGPETGENQSFCVISQTRGVKSKGEVLMVSASLEIGLTSASQALPVSQGGIA